MAKQKAQQPKAAVPGLVGNHEPVITIQQMQMKSQVDGIILIEY
jgi:hypothetical protein